MPIISADDRTLENIFEEWVLDSGITIRYHVACYTIEKVYKYRWLSWILDLLKMFDLVHEDHGMIPIMKVMTNRPQLLKGRNDNLLDGYRYRLKMKCCIDNIEIIHLSNLDIIRKNVINKWRVRNPNRKR